MDYAAFVAVNNAVHPENKASVAFMQRFDNALEPHFLNERILAIADKPVGAAHFGHNIEQGGAQKFTVDIMVQSDYRLQGIGTALYNRVQAFLAPYAPEAFEAWTGEDDPEGIRFLEKRGFELSARQVVSYLDLGRFNPTAFASDIQRVADAGIALLTLREYMAIEPDYQRQIYDAMKDAERDVPWYETGEGVSFNFFATQFDDNPDLLPDSYVLAVEHGKCVGLTQLWASQATDEKLYTGITGVNRSHRGHGVATALKVKSLGNGKKRLAGSGRAPIVETQNHETNPMLQINLRLGFVAQPASLVYVKRF